MPELYIIAGCNGAGKTTAANLFLQDVFTTKVFINADSIAVKINPLNPESVAFTAGRMMLEEISELLERSESFAVETTLATKVYFDIIKKARLHNYYIILYFFFLPSPDMAIERVALRVKKGGHDIPTNVIERRFFLGIKNFFKYAKLVDSWLLYKNDTLESMLIAEGQQNLKKKNS